MPKNKQSINRILNAFQSCRDGLVSSIMKMNLEQQDVDDILQESFISVLDSDAKQQIKSPKGYLSRYLLGGIALIESIRLSSKWLAMVWSGVMFWLNDTVHFNKRPLTDKNVGT
jgi:hypothetical protein